MYRTIDAAFWTDPKVRKLNPNARYFLLYLITNPHTHVSGLYYLPPLIMQHETGLPKRTLDTLSENLDTLSISHFDTPNELVWVVNMFKFQGSGSKNTLSAAHHIKKDIHNSYLINRFTQQYPLVGDALQKIGYSVGATPENRERIPDPGSLNLITDPEQYTSASLCGEFANVKLSDAEREKLATKFGHDSALQRIEALSAYMQSTGKKYKSHYATILTWNNRNGSNGNGQRKLTTAELNDRQAAEWLRDPLAPKVR